MILIAKKDIYDIPAKPNVEFLLLFKKHHVYKGTETYISFAGEKRRPFSVELKSITGQIIMDIHEVKESFVIF